DAERPIGRLVLHRWVPPAVEMDDMGAPGRVCPAPARLERKHEERDILVLLELAHQVLALLDLGLAMQDEAGPAEHRAEERREWRRRLPELGEDQGLLLACRDFLGDVA